MCIRTVYFLNEKIQAIDWHDANFLETCPRWFPFSLANGTRCCRFHLRSRLNCPNYIQDDENSTDTANHIALDDPIDCCVGADFVECEMEKVECVSHPGADGGDIFDEVEKISP